MRILFSTLASAGHTFPTVPLARALRDAGHDVRYATQAGFLSVLDRLGFAGVAAGRTIESAFTDPALPQPPPGVDRRRDPELIMQAAGRVFGDLLPRAYATDVAAVIEADRPDLVVAGLLNPGAVMAADGAGVPVVVHGFGRPRFDRIERFLGPLESVAAELGLPVPDFGFTTSPYVDIWPPALPGELAGRSDLRRIPLRPESIDLGPESNSEAPLPVDEGVILLTLGTAFGQVDVLQRAAAGLAELGRPVVLAAGPTVPLDALGTLPSHVTVRAWVDQREALGRASLVVHHGGSGTTLGAAAAGLPQLFLPQGADQFDNAESITAYGAGATIPQAQASAERVAAEARTLLETASVAGLARRLADDIAAMPAAREVAASVVQL